MAKKFLYKKGDVVNDVLEIIKQIDIEVSAKNCKNGISHSKGYLVRCVKDGYEREVLEKTLKRGIKCPICSNKKCAKGINDIATTHPHLVKYFANVNDTYIYTSGSHKKVLMKCPDCGFEKEMVIQNFCKRGFSCNRCGDGISYPNKFVSNILIQLNIDFELEKQFDWSQGKRYDVYIPSLNCIIENHGGQHYISNGFKSVGGRTLEEEQFNDIYKKELAINNGISNYIELNCLNSTLDYLKQSILKSDLPYLLNFVENDVNWKECEEYSLKSLLKTSCYMWEKYGLSTLELSNILKINRATVINYLKKGNEIGICSYNPKKEQSENVKMVTKTLMKRIYIYDENFNFITSFLGCNELSKVSEKILGVKIASSEICRACNNKIKSVKGFIFSYEKLNKKH